jgi:hypothetical protein
MDSKISLKDRQSQFLNMILTESPQTHREEIYSNAYRIRFEESLREDFPVAIQLDPNFETSLNRFCAAFGSQSWSLNHLAQRWVEFLSSDQAPDLPLWLLDLYRLEGLQFQSFFLDESSPLSVGNFELYDEVELIQRKPFYWMISDWNVEEIWQLEQPPKAKKRSLILFYKIDQTNTFVSTDSNSAEVLAHLFKYKSFQGLSAKLQLSDDVTKAFTYLAPLYEVK